MGACMSENRLGLGGTEIEHHSQLLFRLCKLLLPGFPFGRVLHKLALAIVTTYEVNR